MRDELVQQGIRLLLKVFFDEKHKSNELAITSLELFFEVGLFDDIGQVARLIEEEYAFALLEKMKLIDYELVKQIELRLRGITQYPLD